MGENPLLIKERLGHEKIQTTLGTYGHLYPNTNLIKSMPEKNLVLYASPGEKGRKKKVKIVQYPGRAGKGSFYK